MKTQKQIVESFNRKTKKLIKKERVQESQQVGLQKGEIMPNSQNQTITIGVKTEPAFINHLSDLWVAVIEEFNKQPDECLDGGNDKRFFSFTFQGIKLFVAENEVGGLTVMLPDEY